jgi:hypothetical protein
LIASACSKDHRSFFGRPLDRGPHCFKCKAIYNVIDPMLCRPYYRPGFWVPHCTLGMNIRQDRRAEAMAFVQNFRGGIEAVFDVIDCVTFPPLRVTAERRLPRLLDPLGAAP